MIKKSLDVHYATGIVVASMIGSGVFVSTGFLLNNYTPSEIMLAWVIGALWALCGSVVYIALATEIPKDGGEVEYIKLHIDANFAKFIGVLTIVLGFASPIAFDALVAGSYLDVFLNTGHPKVIATLILCTIFGLHISHKSTQTSHLSQQFLVGCKIFIVGIICLTGIFWLQYNPPVESYQPPRMEVITSGDFFYQQYWITYAFTGFNAAIYITGSLKNPDKDLRKSILYGLGVVIVLYLTLNHIFVMTLQKASIPTEFFSNGEVPLTLGHILIGKLFGESVTNLMSLFLVLIFLSSIVAMTQIVIPVAKSTFSEYISTKKEERVNTALLLSVTLLSLFLIWFSQIRELLEGAACTIYIVSTITASLVFFKDLSYKFSLFTKCAAVVYMSTCIFLLYCGLQASSFITIILAIALIILSLSQIVSRNIVKYETQDEFDSSMFHSSINSNEITN